MGWILSTARIVPQVAKEAWSEQKVHKKVLDRGKPEDAMPGLKNTKETLPTVPLSGMLNKSGGKVHRLLFSLLIQVDCVLNFPKSRYG